MSRYSKAALLFLAVISAFNLGRYTVEFSGSTSAWVSVAAGVIVLAIVAYALLASDS
jgi:hypothetical protein